tara:strand:+ start:1032 stop:1688 length:657 start_codon:yes stop_codon:yes gene_type:complete
MQFSKETLTILKNFASINQSLLFTEGNSVATVSPQKTIMAKAKIEEKMPIEVAIYDLNRFLAFLGMFDNPDIEFGKEMATVKKDKFEGFYAYTDKSLITTPPANELPISPEVTFDLDQESLSKISKAMLVTQLPNLEITGDGTTLYMSVLDKKNKSSDVFRTPICPTDHTFCMIFKEENWKFLERNYKVGMSSNGIALFTADDVEYYVAVETGSSFDG